MVPKSPERLMYAATGVRVAVMGHTIAGVATCTSVLMATVYVDVATLGSDTFISTIGAGTVSKVEVEQGSLIMIEKLAVAV